MRTIELTKNQSAIVDDIDADLDELMWYAEDGELALTCYAVHGWDHTCRMRMHRVIMERVLGRELLPSEEVDHKDLNGLNNRRSNLRLATHRQNMFNRDVQSNNTSGFKGVSWKPDKNKWKAYIMVNGRQIHLGYFDTPEEAARNYDGAAILCFGKFAKTNAEIRGSA